MIDWAHHGLGYDPTSPSGLVNLRDRNPRARKGTPAGSLRKSGYWDVQVGGQRPGAHRIIWEIHHGPIPEGLQVDHVDGYSNRIENLRLATRREQVWNTGPQVNSLTGIKGVSPSPCGFYGRVYHNGVKHSKHFKTVAQAEAWVKQKRKELHGEFARHSEHSRRQ